MSIGEGEKEQVRGEGEVREIERAEAEEKTRVGTDERGNAKAPLYEALLRYKERQDASFHVPGHKNGMSYGGEGDLGGELAQVMEIDVTEITGTDDLHHPEGAIREAQQLAAEAFGAEESFFLVGGSTAGNLALILSVCHAPGDVLLVQRNVHKSVIHGLMLANAHAVFLAPQRDPGSGLATIPSEATVREALRRYPGAKGLLVTHPNYYGMGTSLRPLAALCRASGVPLLVDEAHGAHFGLHPALPESALQAGADGVVQSTHKMLTALTMGAMLHVQGGLLDRDLLRQRLAMVQSSSPSYPIMASLDLSRSRIQSRGSDWFAGGLAAAERLRRGVQALNSFGILEAPGARGEETAYVIQDPFKAVLYDRSGRLSGYELQDRLEEAGCVPEMSDDRYVVLALSPATSGEDVTRLLRALERIELEDDRQPSCIATPSAVSYVRCEEVSESTSKQEKSNNSPPFAFSTWNIDAVSTPVIFGLRPLSPGDKEAVSLENCAGRLAAEMIIPYPPGIPLLYPGEEIEDRTVVQLIALRQAKAKCQGAADPTLSTIQVIREVAQKAKERKQGRN